MRNLKSLKSILCLWLSLGSLPFCSLTNAKAETPVSEVGNYESKIESFNATIDKYNEIYKKNEQLIADKFSLQTEINKLKHESEKLNADSEKYKRRMNRYKRKYEQEKNNVSPEEMQNEIEKVKTQMLLEFTEYLGEYIKSNPKKRVKNIDLRGLLNRLITLNINYTNNGDTMVAPVAVKGAAKATVAGAAIAS